MNRQEVLARSVRESVTLTSRYLAGFDDTNVTRQATNLPNHVAWSLGHLAVTMHRAAERIDGRPIPPDQFIAGDPAAPDRGARGDRARFHTDSVGFGSLPTDDPSRYPSLARSVEIFTLAAERLAAAVRAANDADLDVTTPWGQGETPKWALVMRMVFHNGDHAGQIADLRRALGFRSIFG
ncbi:MAG: DinB family protein [Phycisphaerae bacterium]|nr:DinB family protein [Phycisphaerae bacterium]